MYTDVQAKATPKTRVMHGGLLHPSETSRRRCTWPYSVPPRSSRSNSGPTWPRLPPLRFVHCTDPHAQCVANASFNHRDPPPVAHCLSPLARAHPCQCHLHAHIHAPMLMPLSRSYTRAHPCQCHLRARIPARTRTLYTCTRARAHTRTHRTPCCISAAARPSIAVGPRAGLFAVSRLTILPRLPTGRRGVCP
jgi:hypothetical protein